MKKGLIAIAFVATFMAIAYAAATKFTSLHVTNDLTVEGNSTFATMTVSTVTASAFSVIKVPLANVTTSTPTVLGQIVRDSNYILYIGTNTTGTNGWQKVGTQS